MREWELTSWTGLEVFIVMKTSRMKPKLSRVESRRKNIVDLAGRISEIIAAIAGDIERCWLMVNNRDERNDGGKAWRK
jgi:hypothetical protein